MASRTIEIDSHDGTHVIRTTAVADSLMVEFWGRAFWVPAGTVRGTTDDSEDAAVQVGLSASRDYKVRLRANLADLPAEDI